MSNIHTLFKSDVYLEPQSHRYFDSNGNEYMSVSRFLKFLYQSFEQKTAYKMASQEKRDEWKSHANFAAGQGTNMHEALELYNKTGQILEHNSHLSEAIKSIMFEYKDYYQTFDEICLFNRDYRVAGTTDKICITTRHKSSEVDIADFKNNIKGISYYSDYKDRLYEPLSHLHDCNYVKYSIQLSLYAHFFEELTGRKVRQIYIHYIPPHDPMKHYKIPVMYMKNDVVTLLEHHKENVLKTLQPHPIIQLEDEF